MYQRGRNGRGRGFRETSFLSLKPKSQVVSENNDFEQQLLSWRLSTINMPLAEAESLQPLPLVNDSMTAYYDQFRPLVLEEARGSIANGLVVSRVSFTLALADDVEALDDGTISWKMRLKGQIPSHPEHGPAMNVLLLKHTLSGLAVLVLVFEDGNNIEAKVMESFEVVADHPECFKKNTQWQATYVTSLISQQRMYQACIKKVPSSCLSQIISAQVLAPIQSSVVEVMQFTQTLNSSQQHATQSFITAPEGVMLLKGPPGTGKTTTITSMLGALQAQQKKILVTASSNKSVQTLAERFLRNYPHVSMLLVGVEGKVPAHLESIFPSTWKKGVIKLIHSIDDLAQLINKDYAGILAELDRIKNNVELASQKVFQFCFEKNGEIEELVEYLRAFKEQINMLYHDEAQKSENKLLVIKKFINEKVIKLQELKSSVLKYSILGKSQSELDKVLLSGAKVVFSTLSACGRSSMLNASHFSVDVLIVDEAGQSAEAETLIAFQFAPKKVLLVGDTKQLSASANSSIAENKGYSRSMMGRLEQSGCAYLMLDTQYRMDSEICRFPSHQYYSDALNTHASVRPNVSQQLAQAVAFYDIASGRESANRTSRQNNQEAHYVLQIIRKLRATDQESRIGVISFYSAQVECIQTLLQDESNVIKQKVTVNTVDGFQGDEREIIILSCVCANEHQNIGFLDDARRLNVAITRAKNSLIILGNAQTLAVGGSDLHAMIVNLHQRAKCFTEQQLDIFVGSAAQQDFACRFYNGKPNSCRNGDRCTFSHGKK